MNLVDELDKTLTSMLEKLSADQKFSKLISGEVTLQEYLNFLTQTYHYVINTPKTLSVVAHRLEGHRNPTYQMIRKRFLEHSKEEKGHHFWILDDAKALGYAPDAIKNAVPSPAVCAYNAYSYFVATSNHPIGISGQAFILEGFSEKIGPIILNHLIERSKIPNITDAVSFIEAHAKADVGHMASLRNILRIIVDEDDKHAIHLCAEVVAQQYTHLLHDIEIVDSYLLLSNSS